jgi:predicted DsbA family dithiol-disulfide isomerase
MNDVVTIDVYSDVICPWCYVGKRRLEHALAELKTVRSHVTWRPFQLNPTMPKEGMDRTSYLEAKFGGLEVLTRLEQHVHEAGATERLCFAFDKIDRTPNTFAAHRLIWYAGQQGCQDAVVKSLFRGYFEEGADIGSLSALARLVEPVGLDTVRFLLSEEGVEEVKAEESAGHRLGIRAVPYFLMNQTYAVSGAQPVEVFVKVIEKMQAQQEGLLSKR